MSRRYRNPRLTVEPVAAVLHGRYVIEGRFAVARVDRCSLLADSRPPMIYGVISRSATRDRPIKAHETCLEQNGRAHPTSNRWPEGNPRVSGIPISKVR